MSDCLTDAISLGEWPNCSTADCPNKVCFRFENDKCWPCTMGLPANWFEGMPQDKSEAISKAIEEEWWSKQK